MTASTRKMRIPTATSCTIWYHAYAGSDYRSEFFGEKYKVVRGGSWNHPHTDARTTARDIAHPAQRIRVVGFRCTR